MATQAYIVYEKMIAMGDEIQRVGSEINTLFEEELLTNRKNEVEQYYSGQAATAYGERLKAMSVKVQDNIKQIVTNIKTEAETQKAAFEAQDARAAGN